MQTEQNKITIKSYLNLSQLLEKYRGSHEENRLFSLKYQSPLNSSTTVILKWLKQHTFRVIETSNYEKYMSFSTGINNLLIIFSLLFGIFTGVTLLSYSGNAPINIIYYLFVAMFLPLISMLLTLFSMLSNKNIFSFFTLFFALPWIEKVFSWFSFKEKMNFISTKFSFRFEKWLFLSRLQLFSLLFSLGIFLALIFMVISQDIAFSWSTTLDIDAQSFHAFLEALALPWKFIVPSALPSLDLVELSQHYRLGESLNEEMLTHANRLGAWWKYLALNTLFYAIVLRFFFLLFSRYKMQKVLEKDFFEIEGIAKLLREFDTPYLSTKAVKVEEPLEIVEETKTHVKEESETRYPTIIGWNFSQDEMILINDNKEIVTENIYCVGGSNSFSEDEKIANEVDLKVLLYVKAWEPPTMDFVDFLELLIENRAVEEIQVFPLGLVSASYKCSEKELAIWNRKIEALKSLKVWVIDA